MSKNIENQKFVLCFLLSICLILSLTVGCRKGADIKRKKVQIVYGTWEAMPKQQEYIKKIINEFNKNSQDIEVKLEVIYGLDKLIIELASGVAPDCFFMHRYLIGKSVETGTLLSLDDFINSDTKKDYYQVAWESLTYNGKIYGMPVQMQTMAVIYNKTLFDRYNIPYPKDNWRINDFLDTAISITRIEKDKQKIYGLICPKHGWHFFLRMNGTDIFNNAGTECLLDTPRAIEALKLYCDMRNKYKVMPTSMEAQERGGIEPFMTGTIGMYLGNSNVIQEFEKIKKFEWDVVPAPLNSHDDRRIVKSMAMCNSIYAKTKHPKEAYEFLRFYSSKRGLRIMTEICKNGIPPHRELVKEMFPMKDTAPRLWIFWNGLDNAIPLPMTPTKGIEARGKIQPEIDRIVLGLDDINKISDITKKANAMLKE